MSIDNFLFYVLLVPPLHFGIYQGVYIPECSKGEINVVEFDQVNLTCLNCNKAKWGKGSDVYGECNSTYCEDYDFPGVSISFVSPNQCRLTSTNTRRDDTNATFWCNETSSWTASCRMRVMYPPPSKPAIKAHPTGPVYANDTLTLNCTINGGDPPVTSVKLTCPHENQTTSNQSAWLNMPATANDDGRFCVCGGQWLEPNRYSQTASYELNVYYPPSTPEITRPGNPSYPYMENDIVHLSCDLQSWGNPQAVLSWRGPDDVTANAQPAVAINLTFTAERNGIQSIRCDATNDHTEHKNVEMFSTIDVQVYYFPDITLAEGAENACSVTPDLSECVVTEGEQVHILCHADSNPPPANVKWHAPNLDLVNGGDLQIMSANRRFHNGVFQCEVTSQIIPDSSDTRLPLIGQRQITVLVKYQASNMSFSVNSIPKTLIVDESEAVTFDCQAYGRPTPKLRLFKGQTHLKVNPGGALSLSQEMSRLTHTLSSAQCDDTSEYSCEATNEIGEKITKTTSLFVMCAPRILPGTTEEPISIEFRGHPVSFHFDLVSVPKPRTFFTYLGSTRNGSGTEVMPETFSVDCEEKPAVYAILCNVTARDFRSESEAGFYRLTAVNERGYVDVVFFVNVTHVISTPVSDRWKLFIAMNFVVVVVILAIVGTIVYIHRRRRRKRSSPDRQPPEYAMSQITHAADNRENEDRGYSVFPGVASPESQDVYENTICRDDSEHYASMIHRNSAHTYGGFEHPCDQYANIGSMHEQTVKPEPVYQNMSPAKSGK